MWLFHISERQRRWMKNEHRPFGLPLKKRHTALFVVYLEPPNLSPHALSGAFSEATGLSQ